MHLIQLGSTVVHDVNLDGWQVLDALIKVGLRTAVTSAVLLDAATSLEQLRDVTEGDVDRGSLLLRKLDNIATHGEHTF